MEIFTPATPDQGLTALVYIGSALLGTLLFLKGMYAVAFLTAIGATNLARVWLELLRADYRGHGRFSSDLDAGSFSFHGLFVDCRLSLHGSKLGHGVPRFVLRAAPQDVARLDRGIVRVPNSRSKYGAAHPNML